MGSREFVAKQTNDYTIGKSSFNLVTSLQPINSTEFPTNVVGSHYERRSKPHTAPKRKGLNKAWN